jgi:hypothetical protein
MQSRVHSDVKMQSAAKNAGPYDKDGGAIERQEMGEFLGRSGVCVSFGLYLTADPPDTKTTTQKPRH